MTIGYLTPYTKIYPIQTYNYQVIGRDTIKVGGREVRVFEFSDAISFSPSFTGGDEIWLR